MSDQPNPVSTRFSERAFGSDLATLWERIAADQRTELDILQQRLIDPAEDTTEVLDAILTLAHRAQRDLDKLVADLTGQALTLAHFHGREFAAK